ncbi:MAG: Retroviral aspartyl protease [Methanobacteriota archaeon]|nr:MAG: Retroviral aspartyl protease [Euryarchaeota archaeon]
MGLTYVRIRVSRDGRGKSVFVRALVDTGATSTMLPRSVLKSVGAEPSRTIRVRLADGRVVRRDYGVAFVQYGKHATYTWVLFGERGDATVLGALTLEELWLQVDPRSGKLREVKEALMVPMVAVVPTA